MKNKSLLFVLVCMFIGNLFSCQLFNNIKEIAEPVDYNAQITAVDLQYSTMSINRDESDYLKCTLTPSSYQKKCDVTWTYDESCLSVESDKYGAVITGKKVGGTWIKASCNGIIATCLVSVTQDGDVIVGSQYIYSNYSVVQMKPGDTSMITASLYGGNTSDMENFTWEISDPAIASISCSRNNCLISANKTGSTTLKAKHPDSEYDYSFVVYVSSDAFNPTYITTNYNILTIDRNKESSKSISVDLVNPLSATYKNGFSWDYADEESRNIVSVSANLNNAEIVPLKNGVAKLVVTHENAEYPLDIIVRVTTVVENTYINVTPSTLIMNGSSNAFTVTASVENYNGYADPEEFEWEIPEEAESLLSSHSSSANTLRLQGHKNGTFKIKVSHPLSEYSRNILVILQEQEGSAIDSSMYITTEQNFVQTKVGADTTVLSVRLVGGEEGDENDFVWTMDKGTDNGICSVDFVHGSVASRSAATSGTSASGSLYITPLKEGTLNISISHPKCLYETDISVKVFSEYALLEDPVTINCDTSLVKMLNGSEKEITAGLNNASSGDENSITWESSDNSSVSVNPSLGETSVLSACGTGSRQTYVTLNHEKAYAPKKILVLTADTEEELESMKGFFTASSYLRITANETKTVSLETFGLDSSDRITWSSGDSSVFIVNPVSESENHSSAVIQALSKGSASLTASLSGCQSVSINVTVVPEGESAEVIEPPKYLTTNLNAVVVENVGDMAGLNVTGINISESDMALHTVWEMEDLTDVDESISQTVFELAGSPGESVTITANQPGKSLITVSNSESSNFLTINAKCGNLLEWSDSYIVYITTESDVVNIVNGSSTTIAASLVNSDSVSGSFYWNVIQGEDNIEITGLASGTCNIKGIQAGQAVIEISNTLSEVTKEILVNVGNTEEELSGFWYLTTDRNVVTVGESLNTTVTVSVENATGNIISGYNWRSDSTAVATVEASGNVAVIYGHSCGTARISVTNDSCDYPLTIIVNVVDPIAASDDPYIACNNIVTCYVGGDNVTLAAELIGGDSSDANQFTWTVVDSSTARLYASNDTAQVKALAAGVTQVIVSHPKASVSRNVLVICEEKAKDNCYITVNESIIKMSPTDSSRTITASLVNGDDDDVYDFKWWADSYDRINMNYTGQSCLIEPVSSGTVTLHVSHPKAANDKDIVLYISNYSDFAFASSNITLTTGSDTFLNMEVPATGVDCEISYTSSDTSLCTAWGNTSVCTLHPGVLPDGVDSKSCTVTATLQTKGGVKQAQAQLLVVVQKKDVTKPYIALEGSTIITMNKDEKKTLIALLKGNSLVDTTSAGLHWDLSSTSGTVAEFASSVTNGSEVQIKAVNSGKCTLTITHDDDNGNKVQPLTAYIVVLGVSEPQVNLNFAELPIYIGEDTQTLQANVTNDDGSLLQWSVEPAEQDFFTVSFKGNRASLYAQKVGEAVVYCKHDSGSVAECRVKILEPEKLDFFVYDDETLPPDERTKNYISSFQLYPGEEKLVHYESVPANEPLTKVYRSDANYYDVTNAGYVTSYTFKNKTYSYPENVGTLKLTAKAKEGTTLLQITSKSNMADSISVTNSYGNLFNLDKAIVSATPAEVKADEEILYVNYEVRPACSEIIITPIALSDGTSLNSQNLSLEGYTQNSSKQWVITAHDTSTSDYAYTGVASGTLKFKVSGEVNCTLKCEARNYNIITSSGTSGSDSYITVGSHTLEMKVYYDKHTFTPSIERRVPHKNGSYQKNSMLYGSNFFGEAADRTGGTSTYDRTTNTIFLGDGEDLCGSVSVNESYCNVIIKSISFNKLSSTESGNVGSWTVSNGSNLSNKAYFNLYHEVDYGSFYYTSVAGVKNQDEQVNEPKWYGKRPVSDTETERVNQTVQASPYVGDLVVKYYNMATNKDGDYKIPVIVKVRHSPCMQNAYYGYFETK